MNNEESLVAGGFFGVVIGGLFLLFGGISNFLCEMLFWSFVLYVGMIYFEFVPNFVKSWIKKYTSIAFYLSCLSWVPLVVGGVMVLFLGSLLFVDYNIEELSYMLKVSKVCLGLMMLGSVILAYIKKSYQESLLSAV